MMAALAMRTCGHEMTPPGGVRRGRIHDGLIGGERGQEGL